PWQLCGYGRSDWSTKLIRGLTSEAAAGFRSRRGPSHDSTLATPHNAPFSTYKAARVHIAARRRDRCVAARGARAAKAADDRASRLDCALDGEPAGRRAFGTASRARLDRGPNRRDRASLGGKPHGAIRGDCD